MLRLHAIRAISLLFGLCVLALRVLAALDGIEADPAPEIQKIAATVGVWDTTAKYRFTPDAPVFESKSVETVRLSSNRQFLISDERASMPTGWMNQLVITTWDPAKKKYRLVTVMPGGKTSEIEMAVEGSHRSLLYYAQIEGRPVRAEMIVDYSSQTEYKFREERTDQDKVWIYCEGTSRKRRENASNQAMQRTAGRSAF